MTEFQSARFLAFTLTVALVAGCSYGMSREKMMEMPGLRDVHPTSPKGEKCYDFCALAEANCKHMCPDHSFSSECEVDCELDTKVACIPDCPDLWRPAPPPQ